MSPQTKYYPHSHPLIKAIGNRVRQPYKLGTTLQHLQSKVALPGTQFHKTIDQSWQPQQHVRDWIRIKKKCALNLLIPRPIHGAEISRVRWLSVGDVADLDVELSLGVRVEGWAKTVGIGVADGTVGVGREVCSPGYCEKVSRLHLSYCVIRCYEISALTAQYKEFGDLQERYSSISRGG